MPQIGKVEIMNLKHLLLGLAVMAMVASPGLALAQKGQGGGKGGGGGNAAAGKATGGKGSQGAGVRAQGNSGVKVGGNAKGNNNGGNARSAPAQRAINPNPGKVQSNNQIRNDNKTQLKNQVNPNANSKSATRAQSNAKVKSNDKVDANNRLNSQPRINEKFSDRNARDGVRNDRVRNDSVRNESDRQRRNANYRGNANLNRNNSAFFGTRGYFGNNYLGSRNYNTYGNYGRGYGYGGYNGYGGYGLGYGYGQYGNRGFLPFLIGLGLGYGAYGTGGNYGGYNNPPVIVDNSQVVVPQDEPVIAPPPDRNLDYAAMGEDDFRAGRYSEALVNFRHALVEEPNNAGLMLLLAQSLFQTSHWTEAAGATELAMGSLPEERWGTVVENYRQLYGNIGDYTSQLKALEGVAKEQPNDPALRFLLGYHFGFLGFPKQAVRELGKAVELEGRDPAARRLHDLFAAKVGVPEVGPVPEGLKAAAPPEAKEPAGVGSAAVPPEPMPPQPAPQQ
jgi:hypothetical protein